MKRKIIIFICLATLFYTSVAQESTKLGVHGTNSPSQISILEVELVRYGFTDIQIKNSIISEDSSAINKMIELKAAGVEQVVFIRFPEDTIHNVGHNNERIPTGTDSIEVFHYLDTFLISAGPHIDWIQINQEPQANTPYDNTIYTPNQILNWWRTLAMFIDSMMVTNPVELGHLKIITGGIIITDGALDTTNMQDVATIDSIIRFGEEYCDAISVHLHTSSIAKGIQKIDYLKSRTSHPLACTEWSQAKAATETGWIDSLNTIWTDSENTTWTSNDRLDTCTNKQIIGLAYNDTISLVAWNSLIATSPYTDNFIPDFYSVMDSNCFLFACYAAVFQYGNPNFDWRALYTNKVTGANHQNQPFYDEFENLTILINDGYTTNCINTRDNELIVYDDFVQIFPNPAKDFVQIQSNKTDLIYEIYNSFGQFISSGQYHNQIDLSNFISGIYFLKIYDKTNSTILKLIKL